MKSVKCVIPDCKRVRGGSRGMCNTHYFMWWKHGDAQWADKGLHKGTYGPEGNTIEDFWKKVRKGGDDECWEWLFGKDKDGYGLFNWKNKLVRAHRFVVGVIGGQDVSGKMVCHRCDNSSCVNPKHLFVGTATDNAVDREKKHRSRWDNRRGTELTEEEYKDHFSEGGLTFEEAAKEFAVSVDVIRSWTRKDGLPSSTSEGRRKVPRKRVREMIERKKQRPSCIGCGLVIGSEGDRFRKDRVWCSEACSKRKKRADARKTRELT